MRCRRDTTWLWNTGQDKKSLFTFCLLLLITGQVCAHPDFIDSMSRQFFGLASENNGQPQQQNYQASPDPFAHMFGSASEHVPQRPAPQNYQHPNQHQANPPHRQGYYPPQHAVQQQLHPPYNGPPPVYGQQQGFGQRQPNSNGTTTDGYPPDSQRHQYVHQGQHPHQEAKHHYPPVEYQPHYQHQQSVAVEYPKPEGAVVEYQPHYPSHTPQQVEYHHVPVAEHQGPTLEIHTGTQHAYKEPPTHIEYHHPPKVEYHHYTTHKPKRFHLSFNEPSPDYKIIDKHLKLPPVKFRFHINPKIVITSNTKDPLDKKHHDDEHDLEPFPPPDAFSDHNAPPQISKHVVEHYPVQHHYPVEHHHAVEHYAPGYPQAKHAYPVEHHSVEHHPVHGYTYDLSHGHSHLNPHRSLGHYEPTFKIKTKAIIFTEPPPTRPTTTPRPSTTTTRTTTTRRTTARTTTTARPTRRARISARNPGFSVAFTQSSTISTTTDASTTSSATTRRNNSERERENGGISARRDESTTSAETSSSTQTAPSTTSTTTTTARPTTSSSSTSTTTTMRPTTSTTTTMRPTTSTTTTMRPTTSTTTTMIPTTSTTTITTTTPRSTTTSTTTTTNAPSTTAITTQSTTPPPRTTTTSTSTTTTTTTAAPTSQSTSKTPAEETTPRSTTLSIDANEIDMRKATESSRRRPEPLQAETSVIERSESFNLESSESVKVIETTMLIDGKNQTVRFYYITQPVKLPLDIFQKMTGQGKGNPSGVNVIKIRDKRFVLNERSISDELQIIDDR